MYSTCIILLTDIESRANVLEVSLCSLSITCFMLEVHLFREIFAHLMTEPCEFELREQLLDPAYRFVLNFKTYHIRLPDAPRDTSTISISISQNSNRCGC
jgi:hypothetical protein